jgi:PrcB C-terminal
MTRGSRKRTWESETNAGCDLNVKSSSLNIEEEAIMINSVTKTIMSFCIVSCLFVTGCASSNSEQQQMPFQTVEKGSVSPTKLTNGIYVLRTATEWSNFWSVLKASIIPQPPRPLTDFSENVVIAVVDHSRSTGGYSITITHLQTTAAGIVVQAVHQSPGQDCLVTLALDQPYHIVATPIFSGTATLNLTETVLNCSTS